MHLNFIKNEDGLGLIETIAALGLAVVVITSLVSLSVFTLRSSNKGKLLLKGSKIANEQIELVRAYRDSRSWTDFVGEINANNCVNSTCYMAISGFNLTIQSGVAYARNELGGSTQGTPLETAYSFSVYDPVFESGDVTNPNSVSATDPVLRIEVEVRWKVGDEDNFTHIYTDVSNWRTQ